MQVSLFPLLAIALILWFGVFAFMFGVDRRVARLEQRLADVQRRRDEARTGR